jgi:hypothetical protein
VGQDTAARVRPPVRGDGTPAEVERKVAAVREARDRLGHDVDRMTRELRASVGTTMEKILWKGVTIVAGVLAGVAMRKLLTAAWHRTRHAEPPTDPLRRGTGWPEALSWAAASGVGVGVARLVAARGAAAGWEKAMGAPPPGVSAPV